MKADKIEKKFICAYNDYSDDIFRYCFLRVYDRDLARELTQETFIKIWNYLVSGKTVENFKAFSYKVAYHLIVDNSKRKKTKSLDEMIESGIEFENDKQGSKQDMIEILSISQEIDKLEEKYSEILKMRYVDGLSVDEISSAIGESANTIYVRIHRGLKKIKENI